MLAAVLLGMALGSLIVTPLLKRRINWVFALGVLETAMALMALTSLYGIVRSYDLMEWMWTLTWMKPPYDYVLPLLGSAALALLPTSLLLGAAFPIGVVLWSAGDQQQMGRRIGSLYAANVAGAIIGSIAAGFVLVPMLGARASLILIAALPVGGAIALFLTSGARAAKVAAATAAVLFVGVTFTVPDVFNDVVARRYENQPILWHAEDAQTTVTVTQEGGSHQLLIDGMHHATDREGEVILHRAIGLLGLAVQPSPSRFSWSAWAAAPRRVRPASCRARTRRWSSSPSGRGCVVQKANHDLLNNPQVSFRIDDGRNFLLTTNKKFDIITADLILPHLAGAGNLYSRDYFELARRSLTPKGVMVQWIASDSEYQYKMMLRTFAASFPYVTLWVNHQLAVGSNEPIELREEDFARKMMSPQTLALFRGNGVMDFKTLLSIYSAGDKEVRAYVGDGPMLTDDLPIIEYFLSMPKGGPAPDQSVMKGNITDVYKGTIK
jgi:spermidine synthase